MKSQLEPFIQNQLNEVTLEYKIQNVQKSDPTNKLNDRFVLSLPYCNDFLNLEVIFNTKQPELPPDFILPINFFDMRELKEYKSFGNSVLKILEFYRLYQETLIKKLNDEFIQFQYQTILETKGIEYLLYKGQVKMLIPLTSTLKLFIVFEKSQVVTKELIPKGLTNTSLPSWRKDTCLLEYILSITENLDKEIKTSKLQQDEEEKSKKEMFRLLEDTFGVPIEKDTNSISFLFNENNFVFVVFFTLNNFPKEIPIIQLQSMQYLDQNKNPIRCRIPNLPYSPNWSLEDKLKKMKEKLVDILPDFMKLCLRN